IFWSLTDNCPHRSESKRGKRTGSGSRIRTIPACALSGSILQNLCTQSVSDEDGASWVYVKERPSTGFGSVRTPTMIASYPSCKATTLFHGSVHKDIARDVGREECEGPDGDSDSGALPPPNPYEASFCQETNYSCERIVRIFSAFQGLAQSTSGRVFSRAFHARCP